MLLFLSPGQGSSPLARGLHCKGSGHLRSLRIIPARAGFTLLIVVMHRWGKDHPRSRGVYGVRHRPKLTDRGSSPLARGLPPRSRFRGRGRGIIPARAGFTQSGDVGIIHAVDHPRSRGVYHGHRLENPRRQGSSPLARGLRRGDYQAAIAGRIIPARAGFTRHGNRRRWRGPDHPRSRGVYVNYEAGNALTQGSSPLARGLPMNVNSGEEKHGIIPARAGFTCPAWFHGATRKDHPRSRGVYLPMTVAQMAKAGSSPLARGLLSANHMRGPASRIIPARAGFTRAICRRPSSAGDHPRSRGVYAARARMIALRRGSSPLARGLRVLARLGAGRHRIIPARAGFTRFHHFVTIDGRDHPRSRGVYRMSSFTVTG